jgi:hypothetical protein
MSYVVMVIPTHGLVLPLTLHGKPCDFATADDASTIAELMGVCVQDGTRYRVEPRSASMQDDDGSQASLLPPHHRQH